MSSTTMSSAWQMRATTLAVVASTFERTLMAVSDSRLNQLREFVAARGEVLMAVGRERTLTAGAPAAKVREW